MSFFRPTPWWKRALDLVLASTILIVLFPLLLLAGLLVKLGSRGPMIFKQRRLGRAGRPFTIWKLRTLQSDVCTNQHQRYVTSLSQSDGRLTKIDHSSRMTPGGKFLRASSIDEIPQLINVIQGHMSLVGPRPDVLEYDDYTPYQRRRFDVAPGMTGLWQVNGKNTTTFDQMIQYDTQYARDRSVGLDIRILAKTLPAILLQFQNEK